MVIESPAPFKHLDNPDCQCVLQLSLESRLLTPLFGEVNSDFTNSKCFFNGVEVLKRIVVGSQLLFN